MAATLRKFIAGNWKMHGSESSLAEIRKIVKELPHAVEKVADILLCLPATLLSRAVEQFHDKGLAFGGQDCHFAESGAYTGDISAFMLKDAGANYVLTGHSERRSYYGETDSLICQKTMAANQAGLTAIVCIGETWEQREKGETLDSLGRQCAQSLPDITEEGKLIVAYEPVWAIGTGKTPSLEDIAEVHSFIHKTLSQRFGQVGENVRILYGGSVKPDNASSVLTIDHVDGVLVGGASLKAVDFLAICSAVYDL